MRNTVQITSLGTHMNDIIRLHRTQGTQALGLGVENPPVMATGHLLRAGRVGVLRRLPGSCTWGEAVPWLEPGSLSQPVSPS